MMDPGSDRPIAIWQPGTVEGRPAFVRPDPYPLGDHYADRRVIFREKPAGRRRICFFGESVAAGYGYAPHLTPASALELQLREICGAPDFEVVDLARTNETIDSLADTVESALQLRPDALVLFSGNNWTMLETPGRSPYFPEASLRSEYAGMLREAGVCGPVRKAALEVLQKAGAAYARIDSAARTAGIPVILVTPETNLADWENRQPVHWLPGNNTARWYDLYEKALAALQREDWAAAENAAWQMEDLDGANCPSTYRLLARALVGQGAAAKARRAAQAEVDANSYAALCFLGAPQISSGGRLLQERAAERHGFFRVDLAGVFSQYTGSPLPGRRMFLDYCHLTAEGTKVAMAAVAAEVLERTGHARRGISWEALVGSLPDPEISAEAEATARFGSAIHTAHRHLSVTTGDALPEYWCRQALHASPGIRKAMDDFACARLAALPAVLTVALRRNFHSPYRLRMQHGWKYDFIDAPVIRAIEAATGLDFTRHTTELLRQKTREAGEIDLLDPPFFLWDPVERFYPEVMDFKDLPGRAFFRAAWPESRFAIPGRLATGLCLRLTLRLPRIPGWNGKRTGRVFLKINGREAGSVNAGEQWSTFRLDLRPDFFSHSINRLTLGWPPVPPCGDEAWEDALRRLEQGMEADLHPVFGEVFSIKI